MKVSNDKLLEAIKELVERCEQQKHELSSVRAELREAKGALGRLKASNLDYRSKVIRYQKQLAEANVDLRKAREIIKDLAHERLERAEQIPVSIELRC